VSTVTVNSTPIAVSVNNSPTVIVSIPSTSIAVNVSSTGGYPPIVQVNNALDEANAFAAGAQIVIRTDLT
jgi:hypothetical protein